MSTHARIGIINQDRTILSTTIHWDGYPDFVGKYLVQFYNTEELVRELLSFGDISSIGETIGTKHDDSDFSCEGKVTTFYGRDRGETDVDAFTFKNKNQFKEAAEEYNYLFNVKTGTWSCFDYMGSSIRLGKYAKKETPTKSLKSKK